jgi:branched-chain amino acid transport system substrate-binding protein
VLLGVTAIVAACASGAGEVDTPTPTSVASPTPVLTGPTAVPGPGVTATQITLGMTNDMAGTGDTPYAAVTLAMQAYFRKVNAEDHGACGRSIVLTAEDDGYSPVTALDKTKKLIDGNSVLAMVGAISTDEQLAVGPYLNDPNGDGNTADGVPDLFVSSGASAWGDVAHLSWTIDYAPDYTSDGAVLGRYASAHLTGKKLAILYPDNEFGKDYLAGFVAGLADRTQLVASKAYAADAINANDQLNGIKDADADAVLLAAPPEITAAAITYAASIQYAPQWLLSYTNAPSTLASTLGGGASADQLLAGFAMLHGAVSTAYLLSPVADQDSPDIQEHKRIMQTYQGPAASSLTVYGQSLAEAIVAVLVRSCADLTRPGLMTAAESLTGFHSSLMLPGVTLNLSHTDHRAIQALQPVKIDVDGSVIADFGVISAEDVTAQPAPSGSPAPAT